MNCISRNCLLLVVLTCLFPFFVFAEIPAGYYDDAVGKSGEDLQKSLSTILNDATDVGYNGLWNLYKTTFRWESVGHVFRCNELYFWNRSMWHIWG